MLWNVTWKSQRKKKPFEAIFLNCQMSHTRTKTPRWRHLGIVSLHICFRKQYHETAVSERILQFICGLFLCFTSIVPWSRTFARSPSPSPLMSECPQLKMFTSERNHEQAWTLSSSPKSQDRKRRDLGRERFLGRLTRHFESLYFIFLLLTSWIMSYGFLFIRNTCN